MTTKLLCPPNPAVAFEVATGGLLDMPGIVADRFTFNLAWDNKTPQIVIHISEPYGRCQTQIPIVAPSAMTLADPQAFSAAIQNIANVPTLIPPEDMWLYYGASPILAGAEADSKEAEHALENFRKEMEEPIKWAAEKWKQSEGDMVQLNTAIFTEKGQTKYGIYSAELLRNIWTGKLSTRFVIGDKTAGRFVIMSTSMHALATPQNFYVHLAEMIPVDQTDLKQPLAEAAGDKEWDIDEDEIPFDRGWKVIADSIKRFAGSPIEVSDGQNPVGPAVDSYIRNKCAYPAFNFQECFTKNKPLWNEQDFRPAETDPWNYPTVIVFPQQLEFYVDHIYNCRAPRSNVIELRHLINMYLRRKYVNTSSNFYGGEIGWIDNYPGLDMGVYIVPHPDRIAWMERDLTGDPHATLSSLFARDRPLNMKREWKILDDFPKKYLG